MHPSTLRVLKQCILLDQHTPTTDHIGKGSTNSGDALRCTVGKGLVVASDALALEWQAAKLKFDLSAALLLQPPPPLHLQTIGFAHYHCW